MRDFEFESPTTLSDALSMLAKPTARPLAGGTDLIDHIRIGRVETDLVVDIKNVPELNVLKVDEAGLHLGAAVSCRRITQNEQIRSMYPALFDVCSLIGGIQIQSRASVGGNLCNAGAAADATPMLIALGAVCVVAGGDGTRELPVEQFCIAPRQNCLQPGELLVELRFPPPAEHSASHYQRFIPRYEMDIAVVGVAANVTLNANQESIQSVRVGLGAVAETPFLAEEVNDFLQGQALSDELFAQAGEVARKLISPIDDHRGTKEFRTHVTGVLVERVLKTAVERAQSLNS